MPPLTAKNPDVTFALVIEGEPRDCYIVTFQTAKGRAWMQKHLPFDLQTLSAPVYYRNAGAKAISAANHDCQVRVI